MPTTPLAPFIANRIAKNLRTFGYPDVTAEMIFDTHRAMLNSDEEMPHGIVGMFARKQLQEAMGIE
jgi:hypothetical protein